MKLGGGNIYRSGKCDKRQIVVGRKKWRLMRSPTFNQTLMYNVSFLLQICDITSVFLLFAESGSLMHRNFDINKNCELMKVCSWH